MPNVLHWLFLHINSDNEINFFIDIYSCELVWYDEIYYYSSICSLSVYHVNWHADATLKKMRHMKSVDYYNVAIQSAPSFTILNATLSPWSKYVIKRYEISAHARCQSLKYVSPDGKEAPHIIKWRNCGGDAQGDRQWLQVDAMPNARYYSSTRLSAMTMKRLASTIIIADTESDRYGLEAMPVAIIRCSC